MVEQLTFLQLDPTAVVAPSADLVAWSRIGNTYDPIHLRQALERDHTLFEHRDQGLALVRPMSSLDLHRADMAEWRHRNGRAASWITANDAFYRRVLELLRESGPLSSRDIPDSAVVPWASTGWTNDRNVTQMLQFLAAAGEVAIAGRRGKQRLWELAERVYPPAGRQLSVDRARAIRDERRLRSLGVARPLRVGDAGVPAEIEGTTGLWRVDPEAIAEDFEGRTALLSPFDRLVHDRVRAAELFGFEYTLEMYKPKAERRWGYFALPVLHHDRLIGKVDAAADRRTSQLVVHAVHEDVAFTRAVKAAVSAELDALAEWLRLDSPAR